MQLKKIGKNGQALVEFIIIIPIMLMLFFTLIDVARVIYYKNSLENELTDVSIYYKNGMSLSEINSIVNKDKDDNINVLINDNNQYTTIELNEQIKPITPGFNYIKDKYFNVSVKRIIPSE